MTRCAPAVPLLLGVLLGTPVGCAPSSAPFLGTLVTDSGGISLVENWVDPENLPVFGTLDPVPLAEIGVNEGDPGQVFGQISEARLMGNGRVLVADGQVQDIRLFDFDGNLVWNFGRRGEGPGEFRWIEEIGVTRGDSVRIFDPGHRRITVLDSAGHPMRVIHPGASLVRFPAQVEFTEEGLLLGQVPGPRAEFPPSSGFTFGRDSIVLVLTDLEAGEVASFGTYLGYETFKRVEQAEGRVRTFFFPAPFGRSTERVVEGNRVFVGTNDQFRILRFDFQGALEAIISVPPFSRPLEQDQVKDQKDFMVSQSDSVPRLRRIEHIFSPEFLPEYRPAFSDLASDGSGHLWVREYHPQERLRSRWFVFEETGTFLGTVEMPGAVILHDIRGDLVLLQPSHPLDVPFVQVHRVRLTEH